jgi:hypothetical protein
MARDSRRQAYLLDVDYASDNDDHITVTLDVEDVFGTPFMIQKAAEWLVKHGEPMAFIDRAAGDGTPVLQVSFGPGLAQLRWPLTDVEVEVAALSAWADVLQEAADDARQHIAACGEDDVKDYDE